MATIVNSTEDREDLLRSLSRSLQSGRLNFLLGSGASLPAIPLAGAIEQEVAELFESGRDGEAVERLCRFAEAIQEPTNKLINGTADANNSAALEGYATFLSTLERLVSERKSTLLPKQATIFTTNYDLFIEKAASACPILRLNDGFGTTSNFDRSLQFSSRNFFNVTFNTSNLYDYRVEIPSANLIKLHGSLSWHRAGENIVFRVAEKAPLPTVATPAQREAFIKDFSVILPRTAKFRETLIDSTYYELLRIYNNELDRANCLLIAFGFSFADEHILGITKRALKNPTLRLVVFAYDGAAANQHRLRFQENNNVQVITPSDGETIEFSAFNQILQDCFAQKGD